MKVKEILSYHLNEDLGVLYVNFILEDNDTEKEINDLEVSEEELMDICELYESKYDKILFCLCDLIADEIKDELTKQKILQS